LVHRDSDPSPSSSSFFGFVGPGFDGLSFAAKDTVANFGSSMIFVDKPFQIGE